MPDIDLFEAYKRAVASTRDEIICWWYFGTISAHLDDGTEVPCTGCQTLMAFKVHHLSPTSMRIDWLETCLLRDLQRGQLNQAWFNPLTGLSSPLASTFYDGPVTYFITKNGDAIDFTIEQAGATILSSSISATVADGRIVFTQREEKKRSFAQQSADAQAEPGVHLQTELIFAADLAQASDPATVSAACSGFYSAAVEGMISAWMDFGARKGNSSVKGVTQKARADEALDPVAWAIFQERFPDFFDGDRVSPKAWRD